MAGRARPADRVAGGEVAAVELLGQPFRRALRAWVMGCARWAWPVVLASAVLSAGLLVYAARNLGMDTNTADMLAPELAFRQRHDVFEAVFPQLSNSLLVVVQGADADRAEDGAAALGARLRAMPEQFAEVFQPESEDFFIDNGLLYLDLDQLNELADRLADAQPLITKLDRDRSLRGLFEVLGLALDEVLGSEAPPAGLADTLERVRGTVAAAARGAPDRLAWGELMRGGKASAKERRQLILAQPKLDYSRLQPAAAAIDAVRTAAAELGLDAEHGLSVRLTGSVPLDHDELASVSRSAGTAGAMSFVLVMLLLFLGLRSPKLVAATVITLVLGLVWTAAFAAFAVGHLNLISVAFAVLFIGLGVDFGIHFCLRYREAREAGEPHPEALGTAAAGVGESLTLSTVAAAIGFLSFLPTAFTGVAELGLISGGGMVIALFANLTVLPALLTLFPPAAPAEPAPPASAVAGAAEVRGDHARWITRGALALGIAAAAAIPFARFDTDPFNLKDPVSESVQTLLALEREDGRPPYTIDVLTPSLDAAVALGRRLEALPEVAETITAADLVPKDQDAKLAVVDQIGLFLSALMVPGEPSPPPDAAARRAAVAGFAAKLDRVAALSPGSPLAVAAAGLAKALARYDAARGAGDAALASLEEALLAGLPKRLERLRRALGARPVSLDELPPDLLRRYLAADGQARVEVRPTENVRRPGALKRFVAAVRAVAPEATGTPVIIVEAGRAVVTAFQQATAIALIAIAVLLLLLLRSWRDAACVLAPLLLAGLLTVATTVALGVPFNFANVIVLPLLLGLGVASGIHLVLRYRRRGRTEALMRSSTPRAVIFSALTTMGSFGSLATSGHRGTASMGLLLTLALSYTLLCFLVVLPAMLRRREARAAERAG